MSYQSSQRQKRKLEYKVGTIKRKTKRSRRAKLTPQKRTRQGWENSDY